MLPVIIVIIVGIVCIVISVAGMKRTEETDTENNTAEINRITDEYELNEEEIAVLQRRVSDKISGDVEEILYNADQSLSTMSNEKMMALGDYAVTVCDEIEKNHKEVMFLYSMLTDKEKELKALVSEAEARSAELKKANELAIEAYAETEPQLQPEEEFGEPEETEFEKLAEMPVQQENNTNDIILEMKRNGMSIMEIARELGLGVGEVKLVVDLYQGEAK